MVFHGNGANPVPIFPWNTITVGIMRRRPRYKLHQDDHYQRWRMFGAPKAAFDLMAQIVGCRLRLFSSNRTTYCQIRALQRVSAP